MVYIQGSTCNFIRVVMGYQQYSSCVTLKVITFYRHKLERAGSLVAALTVSNLAGVSVRGTAQVHYMGCIVPEAESRQAACRRTSVSSCSSEKDFQFC